MIINEVIPKNINKRKYSGEKISKLQKSFKNYFFMIVGKKIEKKI